jgi:hypothetical protein
MRAFESQWSEDATSSGSPKAYSIASGCYAVSEASQVLGDNRPGPGNRHLRLKDHQNAFASRGEAGGMTKDNAIQDSIVVHP